MTDTIELKPCPFCGGADLRGPTSCQIEANAYIACIECNSCDAVVSSSYSEPSEDEAAEQVVRIWNRRPPSADKDAQSEQEQSK